MQYISKKFNKLIAKANKKVIPAINRFFKFVVKTAFEMIMLVALGYCVMLLISADPIVEYALAGIVVFAALYFTKIWK